MVAHLPRLTILRQARAAAAAAAADSQAWSVMLACLGDRRQAELQLAVCNSSSIVVLVAHTATDDNDNQDMGDTLPQNTRRWEACRREACRREVEWDSIIMDQLHAAAQLHALHEHTNTRAVCVHGVRSTPGVTHTCQAMQTKPTETQPPHKQPDETARITTNCPHTACPDHMHPKQLHGFYHVKSHFTRIIHFPIHSFFSLT